MRPEVQLEQLEMTAAMSRFHTRAEKARFGVTLAFIVACFLWGGGSRLDIPGLMFLQPFAIVCATAALLSPGEMRWETIKAPFLLLIALAAVVAVQLIPLPPSIWSNLPGHGQFARFGELAGGDQVWHSISLAPDLTLSSLIGLCIPAAALILFASLTEAQTYKALPVFLVAAAISGLFGLAQILEGSDSWFYRYAITNERSAVGLFANRNHQASFFAVTWPMLALWAMDAGKDPRRQAFRVWVSYAAAISLFPLLLTAGSRAGIALALLGLAFAVLLIRTGQRPTGMRINKRSPLWIKAGLAAALVALAGLAIALSRTEAVVRLLSSAYEDETRLVYLPTFLKMAADFFPIGSGFGSFDPVFRFYEPDHLLRTTYLNHAHNDLIELVITGGLPALVVLISFGIWTVRRLPDLFQQGNLSRRRRFAMWGLAVIVILLASSLVDYPLRTPVHAMLFAFACGFLAQGSRPESPKARGI